MGIFTTLWRFRSEIIIAVQFLAALRKTAQDATREYIRRKVHQRLKSQLVIITAEIALLFAAWGLTSRYPRMETRLLASVILWGVTAYNLFELLFRTLPEIREVRRHLRGKVGYALKYVLQISLVNELLQLNLVFLIACILLGVSSRTYVASHFSYVKPWQELAKLPKSSKR